MDTNLVASLIAALSNTNALTNTVASGPVVPQSWNQTIVLIFGIIVAAIPPTLAAFASMRSAQQTNSSAKASAVKMEEIHVLVNSNLSRVEARSEEMYATVLELSRTNQALQERLTVAHAINASQAVEMAKANSARAEAIISAGTLSAGKS